MPPDEGFSQAVLDEVVDLHRAFETWLGIGQGTPDRFSEALVDGFAMVPPDGTWLDRAAVLAMLQAGRGRHGQRFRIAIESTRILRDLDRFLLVGYVERQWIGERETARRSVALMERADPRPVWRFVQETWMAA